MPMSVPGARARRARAHTSFANVFAASLVPGFIFQLPITSVVFFLCAAITQIVYHGRDILLQMTDTPTRFLFHLARASIATVTVFAPYAFIVFKMPSLWYYYPWLDIPFHMAGGFIAGLWVYFGMKVFARHIPAHLRIPIFFEGAFIVGIGWELFEYFLDIYTSAHWLGSITDTSGDLVNDMIGATGVWVTLRKKL